mgnify:CR=1 FL=1
MPSPLPDLYATRGMLTPPPPPPCQVFELLLLTTLTLNKRTGFTAHEEYSDFFSA